MKTSAGLLIIQEGKMLLAHPTGSPWFGTYTIPKGKVEKGETPLDAAIRETNEEVGILINRQEVELNAPHIIPYFDKNGKIYKELVYYIVKPLRKISIGELQKEEVDVASFFNKNDATERIFWRYEEMLDFLSNE